MKDNPVYEFFHNLDDSLDVNPQPIALSVNPVDSFVPFHYHNHVEMIIPIRGNLDIITEKEHIHLTKGDIFIVGPNTVHKNLKTGADDLALNIALKPTAFSHTDLDFLRRSGASSYLADLLFFTPQESSDDEGIYTVFHTKPEGGVLHTINNIVYEYYRITGGQSSSIIRYELLVFICKIITLIYKRRNSDGQQS